MSFPICYVGGCGGRARLFPGAWMCTDHAPTQPPEPNPATSLNALRARAGTSAFTPSHTVLDDRAEQSGRRVPAARRKQLRDKQVSE